MFRRFQRVLDFHRVIATVKGPRYNLDTVLKALSSQKDSNINILLTFPFTPTPTHSSRITQRRPLELLAWSAPGLEGTDSIVTHFLFREGAHIGWGASTHDMSAAETFTHAGAQTDKTMVSPEPKVEVMMYQNHAEYISQGGTRSQSSFVDTETDTLVLENDNVMTKIPFSFAIAQSALIDAATATIEPVARLIRQWSTDVSIDGKLRFNIRDLRQKKAQMMLVSTDTIGGKALDKPVFFWYASTGEMRSLEAVYTEVQDHLEIERRKWFLQERLQHMQSTMEFLREEHHTALSHRLEWIIIFLITVEVFFALRHFVEDMRRTRSSTLHTARGQ